jgi:hypothetical protein
MKITLSTIMFLIFFKLFPHVAECGEKSPNLVLINIDTLRADHQKFFISLANRMPVGNDSRNTIKKMNE